MKKIITLKLSALVNAKHFNYMHFVSSAITMYQLPADKFGGVTEAFRAAFDRENDVYLRHDRSFYTADITAADSERDVKFRILRDSVKTATLLSDPERRAAAEVLLKVIDLYGGAKVPGMAMDAESGVLTNLVEDLQVKYTAQATLLGVEGLVTALGQANDAFLKLMSDRTKLDSEYGKAAMVEARRATDTAYRALVAAVNLAAYLGDGGLAPFIDYMNAEIERYRISLGQGVGNPDWGSEDAEDSEGAEDGTDEDTTPPPTTEPDNGGSDGDNGGVGYPIEPGPGGDDPDL